MFKSATFVNEKVHYIMISVSKLSVCAGQKRFFFLNRTEHSLLLQQMHNKMLVCNGIHEGFSIIYYYWGTFKMR